MRRISSSAGSVTAVSTAQRTANGPARRRMSNDESIAVGVALLLADDAVEARVEGPAEDRVEDGDRVEVGFLRGTPTWPMRSSDCGAPGGRPAPSERRPGSRSTDEPSTADEAAAAEGLWPRCSSASSINGDAGQIAGDHQRRGRRLDQLRVARRDGVAVERARRSSGCPPAAGCTACRARRPSRGRRARRGAADPTTPGSGRSCARRAAARPLRRGTPARTTISAISASAGAELRARHLDACALSASQAASAWISAPRRSDASMNSSRVARASCPRASLAPVRTVTPAWSAGSVQPPPRQDQVRGKQRSAGDVGVDHGHAVGQTCCARSAGSGTRAARPGSGRTSRIDRSGPWSTASRRSTVGCDDRRQTRGSAVEPFGAGSSLASGYVGQASWSVMKPLLGLVLDRHAAASCDLAARR